MIVCLLGFTGLTIVRIERKQAAAGADRRVARNNATSAVELALRVIANDPNWRTAYSNGVETTPQGLGGGATGTLSWVLEDSDGSLTDADTDLRLKGIGRVGNTIQVSTVAIEPATVEQQPQELRSHTSTSSQSVDQVANDKSWCQYLKVSLPQTATSWKITSIEIYCERGDDDTTLQVRIYEPQPDNMPSSTTIDSVDINSNSFDSSLSWQKIDFSGDYELAPDDGVCIALQTDGTTKGLVLGLLLGLGKGKDQDQDQENTSSPINIAYRSGGVSESDSAMITGDPDWKTYEVDKALRYRLHGVYTTAEGMQPLKATWIWDAAPAP